MKNQKYFRILILLVCIGCSPIEGTFNSSELISSKGEKVYVNTINWGVTDDSQLSIISTNPNRLKNRSDSTGAIYSLDPFIYSFKNDTLKLYFHGDITYKIKENFKTINVEYINIPDYYKLYKKAINNKGYHCVPRR